MIIRTNIDKKLHELLLRTPDYYGDFAYAIEILLRTYKIKMVVIEYLENNPDAKTDDILEFIDNIGEYFKVLKKS